MCFRVLPDIGFYCSLCPSSDLARKSYPALVPHAGWHLPSFMVHGPAGASPRFDGRRRKSNRLRRGLGRRSAISHHDGRDVLRGLQRFRAGPHPGLGTTRRGRGARVTGACSFQAEAPLPPRCSPFLVSSPSHVSILAAHCRTSNVFVCRSIPAAPTSVPAHLCEPTRKSTAYGTFLAIRFSMGWSWGVLSGIRSPVSSRILDKTLRLFGGMDALEGISTQEADSIFRPYANREGPRST